MKSWKTFVAVSLVALASAALAQPLTVGIDSPPRTMDPHGSGADSNLSIVANLFDGLLERDTAGELQPALATSWERVDENTWRFKLREGVTFHNGNPFTWEDVAFTMDRISDPSVSEFGSFGSLVESVTPVEGDEWTIEMTTADPVPFFVQNLHQIFIMDKESTEARSQGEIGTQPIGTGAYELDEWVRGSYLRMSANEDYWGGHPPLEQVEFRPITEPSARLAAIFNGEIDILQGVPVAFLEQIQSNPSVEVVTRPSRRSIFLGFANDDGAPTADVRVRRAIAHAINEQEIIDNVMFGQASPAAQIPDAPTTGYSEAISRLEYDPEKARELLAEAGYEDGFSMTLSGPNDRYVQDEAIMAAIASQLARAGIDVSVDAKPNAVYIPEMQGGGLDAYLLGWFDGSYDFGRSYSRLLHCIDAEQGYGVYNGAGYCDEELDAIYAEATQIVDPAERAERLQDLNELAMGPEKVAALALHYQMDAYAVHEDAGVDFTPRADTWIVFEDISRE